MTGNKNLTIFHFLTILSIIYAASESQDSQNPQLEKML